MANINRRPIRRKISKQKYFRVMYRSDSIVMQLQIDYEAAVKANVPYEFQNTVNAAILDGMAYYLNGVSGDCWAWRIVESPDGKPTIMPTNHSNWCSLQWDWEAIYLEALATGHKYIDTEAYQIPFQYKYCKERWMERLIVLKSNFKHQIAQLL